MGSADIDSTDARHYIFEGGTRVILRDLRLTSTPDWLADYRDLTHLDLSGNRLSFLPDWLANFGNLRILNIRGNEIASLPSSFSELNSLTDLDVSRNVFQALPQWLASMVKLKRLSAAGNLFSDAQESIPMPQSLQWLDLSGNQLQRVPEVLRQLTRLSYLDLEDNRLTALPDWFSELTALRELRLRENSLETLPESISFLADLTALYMAGNMMSDVPYVIQSLAKLRVLLIGRNRLAHLPQWIGDLVHITQLHLGRNQLVDLPESLGRLTDLIHLNLRDNRLHELPTCLASLSALQTLIVDGNPLNSPLAEIAKDGTVAIQSFLGLVASSAQEQWWSKLLVVGEGGAGKTSVIKALQNCPCDPQEPTTHGTVISQIKLAHPSRPGIQLHLSSWDFGGQDIYHATHQFFLSDRSLFLLLWNARLGWEQGKLRYWLDIIKARAPAARVILVATHADDRAPDLPLADLVHQHPQIVASFAVDNATGKGIDRLRHAMARVAGELPLMGSRWPTSWLAGAEKIRATRMQYATPEALFSLLAGEGVADAANQEHLLRALHALGDILYYDDDEELQDTVILHPQWVTTYISKVLDSADVATQHGLLTRQQVRLLWHDLDVGVRDRFLRMMEKFDLSYRIRESPDACLIVERLPWENPDYQTSWQEASCAPGAQQIAIRYQLSTVPPGIPTWFIAREHRFTTGLHWRSGALLRYTPDPRVLGLIRADNHSRTVDLAVSGPSPQLFFSILRDGFESTLTRYKGLDVERYVPCVCGTEGLQCQHLYRYDDLLRRLEATPPRPHIECPRSFAQLSVNTLLWGLAPTTGEQILARLESIDRTVAEHTETGWAQRDLLKVLRSNQAMYEVQCPSLFTLGAVARKRTDMPGKRRYQLRLYCEQPGAIHAQPGDPYIFERPPEWLARVSPYLKLLVAVLKHAVPVVGPVLGIASADLASRLQHETDLMQQVIDQLPAVAFETAPATGLLDSSKADIRLDVDYRATYALLDSLDPKHLWAELSRIHAPEDNILWLCRDHARQYI